MRKFQNTPKWKIYCLFLYDICRKDVKTHYIVHLLKIQGSICHYIDDSPEAKKSFEKMRSTIVSTLSLE